ncbi:transposase [Streptococcus thermophilus]|uniref:transposase n=1 Tax=Streptococcus thermophilus TaxID=1308 RepID=UPI003A813325
MTNNRYEPELKQKVLRLYLEEGRTKKSLTEEYNLGQGTLTYWLQQYNFKQNQRIHKGFGQCADTLESLFD